MLLLRYLLYSHVHVFAERNIVLAARLEGAHRERLSRADLRQQCSSFPDIHAPAGRAKPDR